METPQAPIVVRAEKPTEQDVLRTLFADTIGKHMPPNLPIWDFITTKLSYREPFTKNETQMLVDLFNGKFQAKQVRQSTKHVTPIIVAANTYTFTLQFDDKYEGRVFNQTFSHDAGSEKAAQMLNFGREGRATVNPARDRALGMFLCLHPNNADSPLYWSDDKKKRHGVSIEISYHTEPNFRNAWTARIDANKPELRDSDLIHEGIMSALYQLSPNKFEEVCKACLGSSYDSVAHDTSRRNRLGSMVRNLLPHSAKLVSSAMTGSYLNIQTYVFKAEEVGILRFDKDECAWTMKEGDVYVTVQEGHVPAGNAWSDSPAIYLSRLIDGQIDSEPRPSLFLEVKRRTDALAKEFKAVQKEAERLEDPDWIPDPDFEVFVAAGIESGMFIVSKNDVSWGDRRFAEGGAVEEPICKLRNGEDAVQKMLKMSKDIRSAILIRARG